VCKLLIYASQRSLQLSIFHRCHIARQLFSRSFARCFQFGAAFFTTRVKNFFASIKGRDVVYVRVERGLPKGEKLKIHSFSSEIFCDISVGCCAGAANASCWLRISLRRQPSDGIFCLAVLPACRLSFESTQEIKWKRRRRRNKHSLLFDNFQEPLKYWSAWKQIATLADANKLAWDCGKLIDILTPADLIFPGILWIFFLHWLLHLAKKVGKT
jgi:hypothetical protein